MKKYFSNFTLVVFFIISLVYFTFRLPNLTFQPIFADEAIYIRWAQVAKAEPTLRFISLQDGKTPLFIWLMAPFLQIFQDPLFAGRLLSVISGFFTLIGVYFLGRLFNRRVGILGALLVATTPFMVFFDRMALVDSMLAAFTVWSVYFGLKLAAGLNFKNSILFGSVVGLGMLTKTPGMINLALAPLFLMFFDFNFKNRLKRFIKFTGFFAFAGFIAVSLYLIQKVDSNFHLLSSRNNDYIHPLGRMIEYPFDPFIPHLIDAISYFWSLFGLPLILLIPGVLLLPFLKRNETSGSRQLSLEIGNIASSFSLRDKKAILILLWVVIPFCYELQFIKAFTARYILFCIPLLLVLISYEIDLLLSWLTSKIKNKSTVLLISGIFLLVLFLWPAYFSYNLNFNLANVPLSRGERRGYLEDWTAGYGFKEIASYLDNLSKKEKLIVGTEGFFGTLPDGLQIYLDKNRNVIVRGERAEVSEDLRKTSLEYTTFFVTNKSRYPIQQPNLELIKVYPKIVGKSLPPDAILFYRVLPINKDLNSVRLR